LLDSVNSVLVGGSLLADRDARCDERLFSGDEELVVVCALGLLDVEVDGLLLAFVFEVAANVASNRGLLLVIDDGLELSSE
jgi:hypothetical protein